VSLLSTRGVSKRFGGIQALSDVDVDFEAGEIHGLIGPNGSGKSTLLSILSGAQTPDAGNITMAGNVVSSFRNPRSAAAAGIERMPQELALVASMSVAENIVLGHEPSRLRMVSATRRRRSAIEILEQLRLEIDPDQLGGQLPPSQQRLVMLARTMFRSARVVIADEPTAGLLPEDAHQVTTALADAAAHGLCVVYVSHHLDEVARIAARVTVLRDGRVVTHFGQQTNRDELITEMLGGAESSVVSHREMPDAAELLLVVRGLVAGGVRQADLVVRRHEVVGVAGLLGSGRDDLLPAVVGELPRRHGEVVRGDVPVTNPRGAVAAGVGYLCGDRTRSIIPMADIATHVSMPTLRRFTRGLGLVDRGRELASVSTALSRTGVGASPLQGLGSLSGGTQQRALLARWFVGDTDVLLVDEPAVGVDVAARASLLAELAAFADHGAVVVASSDPEDLFEICDRVLCFRDGDIVADISRGIGWERTVSHAIS
jgi:ribose transport system ATP-binding protein